MTDWLIVGAGFTGATLAERIATRLGQSVRIIDKRAHIGGNAYDFTNARGIRVHKYGPHLFHTNSTLVWNYLQRFSAWTPYSHHVLAHIDGNDVPIPFNFNTIEALFSPAEAAGMIARLQSHFADNANIPILTLRQHSEPDFRALGDFIYDKLFANYTFKQWGLRPDQLSAAVTARVPVRMGRDNRYFQDRFQALPSEGYTALFNNMLRHPNIEIALNTDYSDLPPASLPQKVIYTGPIDEFFNHTFGALPYRSLKFVNQTTKGAPQAVGTINYPGAEPYTRITEMTVLTGAVADHLTRIKEFPQAYNLGQNQPYYPIPRDDTAVLYKKYAALARAQKNVHFCGRLANYRYYNMDQAIAAALTLFQRKIMPRA